MINLLPPDLKESYTYAHRNTRLVKWTIAFGGALIGLALISAFGILYIQQTSLSYDSQIASLQQSLKSKKLKETEAQTKEISDNVKLAVNVLSKEVLFSKLIKQLGALMPSNTRLKDLSINQEQSGVDISANAIDYKAATQLQVNLQDPENKIFSKADIVSITCASIDETSSNNPLASRYPCEVTIRAVFAKDNPFLFINSKGALR